MRPLAVAVIGVGHLGQHHARIYSTLPGVHLAAVVDTNPARAAWVAERYGGQPVTDFAAVLSHVDAVSVAVPTSVHYPITKACLEAGLHVLVEKPIASTVDQAEELVALAARMQRVLHVGHIERFNPIIEKIRPYVTEPRFIECHRLSPFQPRGTDVDVVRDLMIHDLDMILSFRPGPLRDLRAVGLTVLSSHLDIVNTRMEFASGCVANLTASRVSTGRLRKLRVFQSASYCTVDYQTRDAVIQQRMGESSNGAISSVVTHHLRGTNEEPLSRELSAFIEAIRGKSALGVSGEEAVAALKLAQQVLDAIASGPAADASSSRWPSCPSPGL
ncbi:MAG: gfo/Idh/MocA family oxidoreductase [Nitrospirae bacterium]|nr:MAG: gfo/Idh/MocA family oxidoreductase [Nitrospirota bacterium]